MRVDHLAWVCGRHSAPRVPCDLEDHERDREADDWVADRRPGRNESRAGDNTERNEAIGASVVAVCDERWARESASRAEYLSGNLVADGRLRQTQAPKDESGLEG